MKTKTLLLLLTVVLVRYVRAELPVTSGLVQHLDAGSITSVSDGSPISTWLDLSGGGNDATQASSTSRPVYVASNPLFNGYAAVHFDGINDYLNLPSGTSCPINVGNFTLFVVAKFDNATDTQYLTSGTNTTDNARLRIIVEGALSGDPFAWRVGDSSWNTVTYPSNTVAHIFTVTCGTGTVEGFLDGNTAGTMSNGSTAKPSAFHIGTNGGASSSFFTGDIAEFVLYNTALSQTNIDAMNNYLAAKYFTPLTPMGLTASPGNNSISLDWDDNEIEPTSYIVYRSATSGSGYSEIASGILTSAYTDNTVSNGTPYYYVVTALGPIGDESDTSNEASTTPQVPIRYMENLDRGVVAVYKGGSQVYVGWRMFGTDPANIGFNVYRNGTKINSSPITGSTNYLDTGGSASSIYRVAPVIDSVEQELSSPASTWSYYEDGYGGKTSYHDIPLQKPANDFAKDGTEYSYSPNDCSVADLDGDGQYEIVLKWEPSMSAVSGLGFVGKQILDAYELDGTFLWRIDLGINIRAGSHYTAFMVYDLDSDGKAELVCKTADGTTDGVGTILGDPGADWRDPTDGSVLEGPEYLSVFDGQTGAFIDTVDYIGVRGTLFEWGDDWNRVDRFLGCVAYLDGVHPSVVMTRGIYDKILLEAWDFVDGQLELRWVFDTDDGYPTYEGQGNHNLSVADVDDDGFDEIIYGACTIDDDGSGLYSTGRGHGDALHVSDMDLSNSGLEVFQCHESSPYGTTLRDALTGAILWEEPADNDTGRCCAAHIDSSHPGYQMWSVDSAGTYDASDNELISSNKPNWGNFLIWWDGDLQREILDDISGHNNPYINKWNGDGAGRLLSLYNVPTDYSTKSNNDTKGTPCLSGDILGDWREECIYRSSDNTKLRIFTTAHQTSERIYTLMHDSQYREAIAWQNVGYNQPPHPSFYIGAGMDTPPTPSIRLVGAKFNPADIVEDGFIDLKDFSVLAAQWMDSPGIPSADIAPLGADDFSTGDGIVDALDLQVLCGNWLAMKAE